MFLLTIVSILLVTSSLASGERAIACENTALTLTCPLGSTIQIDSASYGRSSYSICRSFIIFSVNCYSSTANPIMASQCDGQTTCTVNATNAVFGNPCSGTYKYLDVNYTCTPTIMSKYTCENTNLELSCPDPAQVLDITYAIYGRMGTALCPSTANSDTNCQSASSLPKVKQSCQGKNTCSVPATNEVFGDPCYGTYKYLEVAYTCSFPPPVTNEVVACEGTDLTISCPSGKTIQMIDADYGRSNRVTCPLPGGMTNTCCESRITDNVVNQRCNGRPSCTVSASSLMFGDPCPLTYKYLYAKYNCV